MRRIGIFVFYDKDGIVDEAQEYLINSLSCFLDRLIIVVNGEVTDAAKNRLGQYSDSVFFRDNRGYDGGAYKDVLLNYLEREVLLQYDELLLVNNTFYGPFYPWERVFERVESKEYDFWGLTKHVELYDSYYHRRLNEHVQGYFLVFTKRVFRSGFFYRFWREMPDIQTYDEAILTFEVPLTAFFREAGFSYGVYTDTYPQKAYLQRQESIYSTCCYDLLKDYDFPVLKKKNGVSPLNPQTIPALQFIAENYNYNMEAIKENAERTKEDFKLFTEIKEFQKRFKQIYLYGCGKISLAIENYFDKEHWPITGYLETVPHAAEKDGKPIVAWKDFRMDKNIGVIVALGKKNTEEVRAFLPEKDEILFLW